MPVRIDSPTDCVRLASSGETSEPPLDEGLAIPARYSSGLIDKDVAYTVGTVGQRLTGGDNRPRPRWNPVVT